MYEPWKGNAAPSAAASIARFTALWLALTALPACDSHGSGTGALSEARIYEPVGRNIHWNATSSERFGFNRSDFAASAAPRPEGLHWKVPQGWSELPTTAMRLANFRVAGDERAECYLTSLPGESGGLAANVNRWRNQMSQPPLSADAVAALPRMPWMGGQAVFLQIDGTWTGMSGGTPAEGFQLAGLLLVAPEKSWFLKMIGPRERITAELDHFRALAASFEEGGDAGHATEASALPAMPDMSSMPPMPMDDAPGQASPSFTWTAPEGWRRGPEKAMRELTFFGGERGDVECYVTVLAGDGGGLLANINRWEQQMGRDPLPESALAGLKRFPMLGTQAVQVEIARNGAAAGPEMVIGAVCLQPDRSVFVKMLGSRSALETQRANFLSFCSSLRATR